MSVTSLNWKEALKVVRVGRAVANPNIGFQKQLQDFETSKLAEERRRLKERYPSLALESQDEEQCHLMLSSYQSLILSRDLCEGDCAMGQTCPTGMCRGSDKRILRRKSSTSSATPPQSPRMLPPTPSITHSSSVLSRRPRSGPAGLHSYTGSAPPSRSGSRHDVSELPPGVMSWQDRRVGSAPTTPMASPPASPQHWPRRASTLLRKPSNT